MKLYELAILIEKAFNAGASKQMVSEIFDDAVTETYRKTKRMVEQSDRPTEEVRS
jgi:hypothetical protein